MKGFDPTSYKVPGAYPVQFHAWVRQGGTLGWVEAGAFRWSPHSLRVRFRLFITTLRHEVFHPLHEQAAEHSWKWVEEAGRFQIVAGAKLAKKA